MKAMQRGRGGGGFGGPARLALNLQFSSRWGGGPREFGKLAAGKLPDVGLEKTALASEKTSSELAIPTKHSVRRLARQASSALQQ